MVLQVKIKYFLQILHNQGKFGIYFLSDFGFSFFIFVICYVVYFGCGNFDSKSCNQDLYLDSIFDICGFLTFKDWWELFFIPCNNNQNHFI
ncbi:unnamed protein product [Trifolium pratense]|uniref:Uncharacterized protein n=1 Tax=Trifolium pratense TaxID=57577 RepID=A0ACB0J5S8_TRIPR|nr:unnamed protein product [Trifolium pratense]